MKHSKRQIVISQISKSNLSTSDLKYKHSAKENLYNNPFKNDLNHIEINQSNISNPDQKHQVSSYLEDQEDQIIQSMKQKEKLLKELQILKAQVKANSKPNRSGSKALKPSSTSQQRPKSSAKINTINSLDKKPISATSHQEKRFQSVKTKSKLNLFNSLSSKTVGLSKSKSKKNLLQERHSNTSSNKFSYPTLRKEYLPSSSSYLDIVALKKLEYDPDILMRSPNRSYLLKKRQKQIEANTNDYGLAQEPTNPYPWHKSNFNVQVKDNSQTIPFRFNF